MRDDEFLLRNPNLNLTSSLTDTYRKFQVYEDENIYENLNFNKSTISLSEVPCVEFEIPLSSHVWKKTLRTETHDYKENNFFYLKNIPSVHQAFIYDESIIFLRNDQYTSDNLVDESPSNHTTLLRNSRDLIENKRRCVYLPNDTINNNCWKPTEISIILRNTNSSHEQESSDFVEGLLKLFDAYLAKSYANDKQQYVVQPCDQNLNTKDSTINNNATSQFEIVAFNDVIEVDSEAVFESTQLITLPLFTTKIPISLNTERKTNICLSVHHLSVSLNTDILFYCWNDKKIKYFINKLLSSSTNIFQDTIQRIIQQLSMRYTTIDSPPLGLEHCNYKVKNNLTDFLKQSCESSAKSSIYDFIVKTTTKYRLDVKSNQQVIHECEKKFNDFIIKPHNYENARALKDLANYIKTSEHFKEKTEAIDIKLDHKIVEMEAENKLESTAKGKRDENIYQPIWKCQTDGIRNDNLIEAEENIYETIKLGPIVDEDEWIVAEEFAFGSSLLEDVKEVKLDDSVEPSKIEQHINPYTTVCVLLHPTDAKFNQIIHDYEGDEPMFNQQQSEGKATKTVEITIENKSLHKISEDTPTVSDSVQEWKNTLKSSFYCEDEEDVLMSKKTFITSHEALPSIDYQKPKLNKPMESPMLQTNQNYKDPIKIVSPRPAKDSSFFSPLSNGNYNTLKPADIVVPQEMTGSYKSLNSDFHSNESLDKDSIGSGDKIQKRERLRDKVKAKFKSKPKDDDIGKQSPDMRRQQNIDNGILFGVSIEKVEKHENTQVPKFVVDCITILNECDKIRTQGIYRASGNKITIETLKKLLNDPKTVKKENSQTQAQILNEHDVHTLTGLLKLYFRELKTPLISTNVFEACTIDLEPNVKTIAHHIQGILEPSKSTLQFLIKHLKHVHKHSSENMMTSSNLSIVWGACIFATKVNRMNSVENNDIKRINSFVCNLIDNYEEIFPIENFNRMASSSSSSN